MLQFGRFASIGLRRTTTQGFRAAYKSQKTFRFQNVRFQSTRASGAGSGSTGGQGANGKKASGIRALIQEYGYSALGVYLLLSCIDLPICFIIVHSYGVAKVKEVQTEVMNYLKRMTGLGEQKPVIKASDVDDEEHHDQGEETSLSFWQTPLFTEAIVAYALHKSLVFIRVPITAGITPSVVKQLRHWGFNVGKQKLSTIAQQAKAKTTQAVTGKTHALANNPKFGTPPSKKQKWYSWFF